jgi:hypothetical protein
MFSDNAHVHAHTLYTKLHITFKIRTANKIEAV